MEDGRLFHRYDLAIDILDCDADIQTGRTDRRAANTRNYEFGRTVRVERVVARPLPTGVGRVAATGVARSHDEARWQTWDLEGACRICGDRIPMNDRARHWRAEVV